MYIKFNCYVMSRYGLAKTEKKYISDQLKRSVFSAALDAGTKGNKKRVEVLVRVWSEKEEKVVERFFSAFICNHETGESVATGFLKIMAEDNIPLANLAQLHSDSSSVLRGCKSGAIKIISADAPCILRSDIGGDCLHHVHNANQRAARYVFVKTITILQNIKFGLTSSPAKVDDYLEACVEAEDTPTRPKSYCTSRWLDTYVAALDTLNHVDSYQDYYASAQPPKGKWRKLELSDDDFEDENGEDKAKKLKGNPGARLQYQKRAFGPDIVETELELVVCVELLKRSHEFLLKFQSPGIKIHVLYPDCKELLLSVLDDICEPDGLKTSKGRRLSGIELEKLVLETRKERRERRLKDDMSKPRESRDRRAILLPVDEVLLGKGIRQNLRKVFRSELQ